MNCVLTLIEAFDRPALLEARKQVAILDDMPLRAWLVPQWLRCDHKVRRANLIMRTAHKQLRALSKWPMKDR